MQGRFHHLYRDEQGMSFVYVGMGFMGFLAASTLAVDVGMFMMARSQAQNAADSGALAGAVALVFNDYNNRSAGGPAVTSAVNAAQANGIANGQTVVPAQNVTFPLGPTGLNNRVGVLVQVTSSPLVIASRPLPVPKLLVQPKPCCSMPAPSGSGPTCVAAPAPCVLPKV